MEGITKIKKGSALIRKARTEAIEWILTIDQMLNLIIAEYFVRDVAKREFFTYEILTREFITTSQKIKILADLELYPPRTFRKHNPALISNLEKLNAYRNTLAHGLPVPTPERTAVMKRSGNRFRSIEIDQTFFTKMKRISNDTLESLSRIYFDLLISSENA